MHIVYRNSRNFSTNLQRAGLDSVYSDLEALGQLIVTAARVATETGLSLPSGNLASKRGPITPGQCCTEHNTYVMKSCMGTTLNPF